MALLSSGGATPAPAAPTGTNPYAVKGFGLVPTGLVKVQKQAPVSVGGGTGKVNVGGSTGMPSDESAAIALQQAAAARQTFLSTLKNNRAETNQNFANQMEDLTTQHPLDQASLNSNYGSSGLGFSSGYGQADQRLTDAYTKSQDRLIQAHQDALKNYILSRQNYQREYRTNLAGIRQAAADRLSAIAGSLGLGNTTDPNQLSTLLNGGK